LGLRLKKTGAVLIAKLATGSLAFDDIWFGGQTKNPWNIMEGSSGSSAGPAASTCAGIPIFHFSPRTLNPESISFE
jgi:Asp-tRNA(Asn)/Glu-tRNA(Gln) amidotransferase A subunit family amidase